MPNSLEITARTIVKLCATRNLKGTASSTRRTFDSRDEKRIFFKRTYNIEFGVKRLIYIPMYKILSQLCLVSARKINIKRPVGSIGGKWIANLTRLIKIYYLVRILYVF